MARKISVSSEKILDTAFRLTKEEGLEQVTARKLANKIGCSTQPIFRAYEGMEQLYNEVYDLAIADFSEFYQSFPKIEETPFINLGMAYINYAKTSSNLFRVLFLEEKRNGKGLYELLNGKEGNLLREINKAKNVGVENPSLLFMKMWIFIHGAACMVITGDYDLDEKETLQLLKESYQAYTKG